jgi:predicted dehydrogenase
VGGFVVLVHSAAAPSVVLRVAERGLPILTEKPPGQSSADATMLAERIRVPNVVGFNRRYMPLARRFRSVVDGIESPFFAECHFYRNDRRHPRFVLETGIHGINFIEYLCGPIVSIVATRFALSGEGRHAWVCPVVFESGMPGLLKFFPYCGSSIERYEVHGAERSAYFHCPASYTSDRPGRVIVHERGNIATEFVDESSAQDELSTAGIIDEYHDFLRLFADPLHRAVSDFRNACNTMRVAEAINGASESPAAECLARETLFHD